MQSPRLDFTNHLAHEVLKGQPGSVFGYPRTVPGKVQGYHLTHAGSSVQPRRVLHRGCKMAPNSAPGPGALARIVHK